MRKLSDLIRAVPEKLDYPKAAEMLSIAGITADSRRVMQGSLFAALQGTHSNGSDFIADAKVAGAAAILCDKDVKLTPNGTVILRSENPRKALAHMAAAFYGQQPEHVVAITGTDGKSSTADFFRQFWHLLGKSSASVGTLGVLSGNGKILHSGSHTTPDPVALHRILFEMASSHIDYVAMEASSHGLDQHRLDGVVLQAGAFTNVARDHLDYHGTEEAYFQAKARLFSELLPKGATAVLNADDARFGWLKKTSEKRGLRVIGFGKKGEQYRLGRLVPHVHGQEAHVTIDGKEHLLDIPLVGAFQTMNILAALGLVVAAGAQMEEALEVIGRFSGVPGRLELVARLANGASVFVDYAHTPMALRNILETLRPHTQGKLHVLFGCGGDRDKGKRPEMGAIAEKLADRVIVTDDNPRGENPALIRKAILAACPHGKEVADRKEAIYAGLRKLAAGDVLVLAGKGHEKTQIIGTKTIPFDDGEVARIAAQELQLLT